MKVALDYFKPSGKWYSSGEMDVTPGMVLFEVWRIVRAMLRSKTLPGLISGHSNFIVSVDVPEHRNRHPHLIIEKEENLVD